MKIEIRNNKDLYAGFFFLSTGIVTALGACSYSVGTARRMGPGYFPLILGCLLILLGFVITVRGLRLRDERMKIGSLRPLLLVSSAALSFGFLLRPAGLILAILSLVFLSCLGGYEFRIRHVIILFLVLAAIATGLFVYALGLPYHLFWSK